MEVTVFEIICECGKMRVMYASAMIDRAGGGASLDCSGTKFSGRVGDGLERTNYTSDSFQQTLC